MHWIQRRSHKLTFVILYDTLHYKIIKRGVIDLQSQVTIRLSNEMVDEILAIAKRLHLKRSDIVRIALEKFIDEFGSEEEVTPYEKIKELTYSYSDRIAEKIETYGEHATPKKLNNISIDDSLFNETKAVADELKISQSQIFTVALRDFLDQHENQRLLEKINEAYSDAPDPEEHELLQRIRNSHRRLVEGEW